MGACHGRLVWVLGACHGRLVWVRYGFGVGAWCGCLVWVLGVGAWYGGLVRRHEGII
jgi:hypothetical protein